MFLKYFYDQKLAHASYMVGCQRAKAALIVDPGRDIAPYLEAAASEGFEITAVAETHIHADYVSGARELADRVGAKLHVSDEGPTEWKSLYLDQYDHQGLHDGDQFMVGGIKLEVMHTPGHTPESISFLLTDQGGGAEHPMGIFTGDFVFVGSIGRPDLLEEAAGIDNTAEPGARDLYQSIERFRQLPDHLQVWPAHGAGSACGKGLGAIPSSTVGYEKRVNPALQYTNETDFVNYILTDQPEAPKYFGLMKQINKEGPAILGKQGNTPTLPVTEIDDAVANGTVIDLTGSAQFGKQHVGGTLNIPSKMLAAWAGWLVDYSRPVYLISDGLDDAQEATRVLQKIGIDRVAGFIDRSALISAGRATQSYPNASPQELAKDIENQQALLIDVRNITEWNQGHIPQAQHRFLGKLPDTMNQLPNDQRILIQCQSGARSAIAASLLQAAGLLVTNMTGGYSAWTRQGLPVVTSNEPVCSTACNL